MNPDKYPKIILICLACFIMAFFASNRLFRGDLAGWKLIISSDGLGYYSYLPAFIIDRDLTFQTVTKRETNLLGYDRYKPSYLLSYEGKVVNKYFAGEALLLLPFFLLATLFSWLAGAEMSGYSFFFQIAVGLGALFYLFLGLFYLKKIMQRLEIAPRVTGAVLVVIVLGTNLFYYSIWQPSMSHVYSFFAINAFLWFFTCCITKPTKINLAVSGFLLGLIMLIRPTNGIIVLLIPFLFKSGAEAKALTGYIRSRKSSILAFIAGVCIIIVQPVIWHLQTGHWLLWSYRNEGFDFTHPRILSVLFSYRKGLFVYTPVLLLAGIGSLRLAFINYKRFLSVAVFICVMTFIISSWWNWYYGDSFGARAFIDFFGVLAILIAILLNHKPSKFSTLIIVMLFLPFVAVNLVQTWQYSHYIISPYCMNKAKYDYVFLKTDSAYQSCLGGNNELPAFDIDMKHPRASYFTNFETPTEPWRNICFIKTNSSYSGHYSGFMDSLHPYSATLLLKPDTLAVFPAKLYVVGNVWVRDSVKGASNNVFVVISMDSLDIKGNYWFGFHLNDIPDNEVAVWRKCNFSLSLPELRIPGKLLKIYLWNSGKKPVLIDDFSLTFYAEKDRRHMGLRN